MQSVADVQFLPWDGMSTTQNSTGGFWRQINGSVSKQAFLWHWLQGVQRLYNAHETSKMKGLDINLVFGFARQFLVPAGVMVQIIFVRLGQQSWQFRLLQLWLMLQKASSYAKESHT